jgi:hypothetical protein
MKPQSWWSPEGASGSLLSNRWVQTFVFELPPLRRKELEASLRYKVQALLPVNTESFAFHMQFLRLGKKSYGAAFLASETAQDALPSPARKLRVGLPLLLPKDSPAKLLLIVSSPEGLASHYYEAGLLKASFAPIEPEDMELRARILAQCPGAELVALAPDPDFPLPPDLREREAPEALGQKLMDAFPLWDPPPPRRYPQLLGLLLLAAGLALCALALAGSLTARERRNEAWRSWLKQAESRSAAPSLQEQGAKLRKAQGAPIPELFAHLSRAWGSETRIVDLEWAQGKLTLTASSLSALASLRKLGADPWFRDIRIGDIRTQKDGSELFTIEGGLSIDS